MKRYNPKEIEPRWQQVWAEEKLYEAKDFDSRPKYVMLTEFPYPSGDGLHLGHTREYTLGDIMARHRRMQGFNVLYPMGYDAFGLPTENYAIKNKISPQLATDQNVANFQKQFESLGYGIDWSRSFRTTDPDYYKWTQWLFLQFFKAGLAYQDEIAINWCPFCKTGLANEEVINGRHERCDTIVERRLLKQWLLKITKYADRLIDGLNDVDYPSRIADQQINWIGRSKGAEIEFAIDGYNGKITVFTTRPDTLFGATFMVLAPEHPLVEKIAAKDRKAHVNNYIKTAQAKTEIERQDTEREKTGEFTGAYAINPVNRNKIPIWVADYVLAGYGTGAIMAVPGHDQRDYEFARKYDLPIIETVEASTFDDKNPPREGKPNTKRNVTICVVKNAEGKFLTLKWNKLDWHNLVMGGIEDGEDLVVAAKREIAEETGYTDIEFVGRMPFALNSIFYAAHKDVNRDIRVDILMFNLKSDKKIEVKREEHEDFELVWIDKSKLKDLHPVGGLEYIVRWVEEGDYGYSGEGRVINSDKYNNLSTSEAREKIVQDLAGPTSDETIKNPQTGEEEPVFVQKDEVGAVRPELPFVEREAITVVVKHWEEDKYIGLKWKTVDWETLITGGVEDGQTPEEAAIMEIREETGYKNPILIKDLGKNHAKFFHVPKNQNRFAHFSCLYFELADGEREEITEDEKKNHELVWLSREQMEAFRLPDSHRYAWNKLIGKTPAAKEVINYKMRDWIFSRQHYWGEPIPIIHCPEHGAVAAPDDQLPIELPKVDHYEPTDTGESPLAAIEEWVNTTCPVCSKPAKRETDTMPNWAGSSWYYLRYFDAHNDQAFADRKKLEYWGEVDMYLGGMEHTTLHLLYSRFWHQFFYDQGLVPTPEPYKARRGQGIILAADGSKMSKSKGNVVNPTEIIEAGYGADALRLSIAFIAPFDQTTPWSPEGVAGTHRFLSRVWQLTNSVLSIQGGNSDSIKLKRLMHKTIKKISEDLEGMRFNTAVAMLMGTINDLYKYSQEDYFGAEEWRWAVEVFLQLLAPYAPHISEELWHQLGHEDSIHISEWPKWDEKYLASHTMKIVVQVNGKLRGEIELSKAADKEAIIEVAKANEKIKAHLNGKEVIKEIYVPGKLINFVAE